MKEPAVQFIIEETLSLSKKDVILSLNGCPWDKLQANFFMYIGFN